MAIELDAAATDSVGAFLRRKPKHALPLGSPCPNCQTALQGSWCHACGQSAEDFHRSLWRLMVEALGGFFELDGRLWRTLPNLLFRPARLTRQYLDGHRAPQAPPFRTFLIVVVLVFLAGGVTTNPKDGVKFNQEVRNAAAHNQANINVGPKSDPRAIWITSRLKAAMANPEVFENTLLNWAQRLSILTLPLSAMMLGPMFFWKRGVYLFDHLIFSMHSLSFQGLLLSTVMLGEKYVTGAVGLLIFASPVHLFFHMKGTYGISWYGTLLRMLLLFVGSMVSFMLLIAGLFFIGLYEMGG